MIHLPKVWSSIIVSALGSSYTLLLNLTALLPSFPLPLHSSTSLIFDDSPSEFPQDAVYELPSTLGPLPFTAAGSSGGGAPASGNTVPVHTRHVEQSSRPAPAQQPSCLVMPSVPTQPIVSSPQSSQQSQSVAPLPIVQGGVVAPVVDVAEDEVSSAYVLAADPEMDDYEHIQHSDSGDEAFSNPEQQQVDIQTELEQANKPAIPDPASPEPVVEESRYPSRSRPS